jgi:protein-S-isoprenylcysteine O-methyltransferase Ste14
MIPYQIIILSCWAAFILVWAVSASNVKRDIQKEYGNTWRQFALLRLVITIVIIIFVVPRIVSGSAHFTNFGLIFTRGVFPPSPVLDWTAAALSVIGVSIAIWARVHLGRNWSPHPAVKEHHELVTSGPYAYVRHPIYTGAILMAFGTALTGSIWGIGVFVITSVLFVSRIGIEEQIMLGLFPDKYPEYQKKTKALIPFVI